MQTFPLKSLILVSFLSVERWFLVVFHPKISCSCFSSSTLAPWTLMELCHTCPCLFFCFLCGGTWFHSIVVSTCIRPGRHSHPPHQKCTRKDYRHYQMHSFVSWVSCCKASDWNEFRFSFRNCVSSIEPYVESLFVLTSDVHRMDLSDF